MTAFASATLYTYRADDLADGLENLAAVYRLNVAGPEVRGPGIAFEYLHSLADPKIRPRRDLIEAHASFDVVDDVVLSFGMMEGSAKVSARRAVFNPQSAFSPQPFHGNGSKADELALVLNRLEGSRLTGRTDPDEIIDALVGEHSASVVVLKQGGKGAIVATPASRDVAPAYRSDSVWKIGSGDVFRPRPRNTGPSAASRRKTPRTWLRARSATMSRRGPFRSRQRTSCARRSADASFRVRGGSTSPAPSLTSANSG